MLAAGFKTNGRDESRLLCQSFGRLIGSVSDLTDPESDALVAQIGGPGKWGKTAVADFSMEGVQQDPFCVLNIGDKDNRVYEIFEDQAQTQTDNKIPVCMFVIRDGIYEAFLAIKGTILAGGHALSGVTVADIEVAESFLKHHFRFVSALAVPEPDVDKLDYDPTVPKLADVVFSTGPVLDTFKLDGKTDLYVEVGGVDQDDMWKERTHGFVVRDRARFQTEQFQSAWSEFVDSPYNIDR